MPCSVLSAEALVSPTSSPIQPSLLLAWSVFRSFLHADTRRSSPKFKCALHFFDGCLHTQTHPHSLQGHSGVPSSSPALSSRKAGVIFSFSQHIHFQTSSSFVQHLTLWVCHMGVRGARQKRGKEEVGKGSEISIKSYLLYEAIFLSNTFSFNSELNRSCLPLGHFFVCSLPIMCSL